MPTNSPWGRDHRRQASADSEPSHQLLVNRLGAGPILTNVSAGLTAFGPDTVNHRPKPPELDQAPFARTRPSLVRHRANSSQHEPGIDRLRPNMSPGIDQDLCARIGPSSAALDQHRPGREPNVGPEPTKVAPLRSASGAVRRRRRGEAGGLEVNPQLRSRRRRGRQPLRFGPAWRAGRIGGVHDTDTPEWRHVVSCSCVALAPQGLLGPPPVPLP